jgi:hypothetical protein
MIFERNMQKNHIYSRSLRYLASVVIVSCFFLDGALLICYFFAMQIFFIDLLTPPQLHSCAVKLILKINFFAEAVLRFRFWRLSPGLDRDSYLYLT